MYKSLDHQYEPKESYGDALKAALAVPYNDPYPGMKEIDSAQFFRMFFGFVKQCAQFKQIGEMELMMFFESDGVGVGFSRDGRFWRCGCEHEMEFVKNLGRCYNQYRCKICGIIQCIDSSD